MAEDLEKLIDLGTVPERRRAWRRHLRAKAPAHLLRFISGVLFALSFLLVLLPLPAKLIVALMGRLRAFRWWMVPLLIAFGWLLGVLTAWIDRFAIHRVMKPLDVPVPPDNAPRPFAWIDSPLSCPCCHSIVSERTPVRGFFACRCGALLVARDGHLNAVRDPSP